MCLKTADVASEDVWGIMLTWRGRSLVHVHTARALFFIILIILKAKLIFLIYLYDFAFCVLRVVVYRFKGKVGFLSFGPSAAFEVSLSESAV